MTTETIARLTAILALNPADTNAQEALATAQARGGVETFEQRAMRCLDWLDRANEAEVDADGEAAVEANEAEIEKAQAAVDAVVEEAAEVVVALAETFRHARDFGGEFSEEVLAAARVLERAEARFLLGDWQMVEDQQASKEWLQRAAEWIDDDIWFATVEADGTIEVPAYLIVLHNGRKWRAEWKANARGLID